MVVQRVIWLCTPMDAHEWRDLRDDARELFDRVVRATVERTTIQSQIEAEERVTYRLVEVEPGP
jgi:agmatine/peptidylarginine deiminase